jgi:hypothetical protein
MGAGSQDQQSTSNQGRNQGNQGRSDDTSGV